MTLRVDPVTPGLLADLWAWATDQAALEGIPVGDLMNRALDAERRRIGGHPRQDHRTTKVGRRGADAQMGEGEYTLSDVARMAVAVPADVKIMRGLGLIVPVRPTRRGIAAAYGLVDVVIAAALIELAGRGVDDTDLRIVVAGLIRSRWDVHSTMRGTFLLVGDGQAKLVGGATPMNALTPNASVIVLVLASLSSRALDRH